MSKDGDRLLQERLDAYRKRFGEHLTHEQFIVLSGATPRLVQRLIALELVHRTWVEGKEVFSITEIARVRKMLRLRHELGVGWTSMDLLLRLLDRIDDLERRVDDQEAGRL